MKYNFTIKQNIPTTEKLLLLAIGIVVIMIVASGMYGYIMFQQKTSEQVESELGVVISATLERENSSQEEKRAVLEKLNGNSDSISLEDRMRIINQVSSGVVEEFVSSEPIEVSEE